MIRTIYSKQNHPYSNMKRKWFKTEKRLTNINRFSLQAGIKTALKNKNIKSEQNALNLTQNLSAVLIFCVT